MIALNNRPSTHLDEDTQLPVLTPNSMLHIDSNHLPKLQPHQLSETNLRKRTKFLLDKCNDSVMWKRWTNRRKSNSHPHVGDVVIIQDDKKTRNQWNLAVVARLIKGRHGIIRRTSLNHICPYVSERRCNTILRSYYIKYNTKYYTLLHSNNITLFTATLFSHFNFSKNSKQTAVIDITRQRSEFSRYKKKFC